jgi:sterol desaturase/sphingolipid hydroxylase (fatty acid hydroxylase superfamily)
VPHLLQVVWAMVAALAWFSAQIGAGRVLELKFPAERRQSVSEIWLDYRLVFVNMCVNALLGKLAPFIAGLLIAACGGGFIHLRADGWWLVPAVLVFLVFGDLYTYWYHRLSHIIPFMWAIHSFHHSAQAVTYATGARHHWLDVFIGSAFFPLFPIVFKTPPEVAVIGAAIMILPDRCAHLNVKLSLGRFALWINNPQLHRIHHSSQPEHFDKNFASVFPFWDILFGTAWRPGPDEFPSTGLGSGDKPSDAWEGLIWPFRSLFHRPVAGVAPAANPARAAADHL